MATDPPAAATGALGEAGAPVAATAAPAAPGGSEAAAAPCGGGGALELPRPAPAASVRGPSTSPRLEAAVVEDTTGGLPSVPSGSLLHDILDHEVSSIELAKWSEMMEAGISQYMHAHPDRFYRRVRRGIPPRFRWHVWKAKVGVEDGELLKDYPRLCVQRNQSTPQIEIDISRTFPELEPFKVEHQQKLLRVLNAYAGYNPEVGYCQGMNFVAGLLLLVSDMREEESFAVLARLMDDPHFGFAGFYRERLPLLHRYLRACDRLVQETVPELRDHFIKESVEPAVYLHPWFLTLFINCFPLSMVMIIWDVIICEGLPVILRIAVSILQVLKDSLLSMHFEEIIKFFKMMKTYDDEDGELNAFRIGQLLMKHTEHVYIPGPTLEYLHQDAGEDEGSVDCDEAWEADLNGGSWLQSLSRMFTFGSSKRRATSAGGAQAASDGSSPNYPAASSSGGTRERPPGAGAGGSAGTSGTAASSTSRVASPAAASAAAAAGRGGVSAEGRGEGPDEGAASGCAGEVSSIPLAPGAAPAAATAGAPLANDRGASRAPGAAPTGSHDEDESLTRGWEFL